MSHHRLNFDVGSRARGSGDGKGVQRLARWRDSDIDSAFSNLNLVKIFID